MTHIFRIYIKFFTIISVYKCLGRTIYLVMIWKLRVQEEGLVLGGRGDYHCKMIGVFFTIVYTY